MCVCVYATRRTDFCIPRCVRPRTRARHDALLHLCTSTCSPTCDMYDVYCTYYTVYAPCIGPSHTILPDPFLLNIHESNCAIVRVCNNNPHSTYIMLHSASLKCTHTHKLTHQYACATYVHTHRRHTDLCVLKLCISPDKITVHVCACVCDGRTRHKRIGI